MTGMEGSLERAKSAPLAQACWTKFWAIGQAQRVRAHADRRRSCDRRDLARGDEPLDPDRQRRALGFQEPVLRVLSLPCVGARNRRVAVLESLSLWRPSERRRSAVADLCAADGALCAVRPGAVAARVRSPRSRASVDRRIVGRRDRRARALAGGRLRAGGGGVHVRRRRRGTAAAYRHHPELRTVPAGAAAVAAGARAPLAPARRGVFVCRRLDRARPQPGGDAALLRAGGGGDRRGGERRAAARLSARTRSRCWS